VHKEKLRHLIIKSTKISSICSVITPKKLWYSEIFIFFRIVLTFTFPCQLDPINLSTIGIHIQGNQKQVENNEELKSVVLALTKIPCSLCKTSSFQCYKQLRKRESLPPLINHSFTCSFPNWKWLFPSSKRTFIRDNRRNAQAALVHASLTKG